MYANEYHEDASLSEVMPSRTVSVVSAVDCPDSLVWSPVGRTRRSRPAPLSTFTGQQQPRHVPRLADPSGPVLLREVSRRLGEPVAVLEGQSPSGGSFQILKHVSPSYVLYPTMNGYEFERRDPVHDPPRVGPGADEWISPEPADDDRRGRRRRRRPQSRRRRRPVYLRRRVGIRRRSPRARTRR